MDLQVGTTRGRRSDNRVEWWAFINTGKLPITLTDGHLTKQKAIKEVKRLHKLTNGNHSEIDELEPLSY